MFSLLLHEKIKTKKQRKFFSNCYNSIVVWRDLFNTNLINLIFLI